MAGTRARLALSACSLLLALFVYLVPNQRFANSADVGGRAIAAFRVHDRQISTVHKSVVDDEKAIRRRECGPLRQYARMGLSALWKVRNTGNCLARLARPRG
jgi:hypothetical protein